MNTDNNVIEIDLLEIFYVLKKNVVKILAAALAGLLLFGAYSFLLAKPVYESTARLYILTQSTSITSFADIQLSSSLAKDYEEMIFSRPVVMKVKEDLQLDYDYEEMKEMLTVSNPNDTRCLNITCRSHDKKEACDMANEYANVSKRQIADIMATDEPTLFEEAVVNDDPIKPEKAKNMAIGFLLGLIIACAVAVIRYMMNDSIKNEQDVERYLGLNTLAAIPAEKTQKIQARSHRTSRATRTSL